jgi:hypothetical protein
MDTLLLKKEQIDRPVPNYTGVTILPSIAQLVRLAGICTIIIRTIHVQNDSELKEATTQVDTNVHKSLKA